MLFDNDRDENEYRAWLAQQPTGPEQRRAMAITAAILLMFWLCIIAAKVHGAEPEPARSFHGVMVPTLENVEALQAKIDAIDVESQATNVANLTVSQSELATRIDSLAKAPAVVLDITQGLKPGADITARLQYALDRLHLDRQQIYIAPGEWLISKTIRTPFKSGLTLLGAGVGNAIDDAKPGASRFWGARTLLRWAGEPGGTMFDVASSDATIGNFVIQGDASRKSKGIVIRKAEEGMGVGCIQFAPLACYDLATAVQCGTSTNMHNCDNLRFAWLLLSNCQRGYHGVNTMGMNIQFGQINAGAMSAVIEMDGGGKLSVDKSVIVGPCTLLKVNGSGGGVGKNNGYFRLSNTEIDAQARDGFTLVDSSEPSPIEFYCDGGIHSQMDVYKGTFARLAGGNHLTLVGWDSSFRNITGTRDATYGRPSVMIRDSRIWGKAADIWKGEITARWRDCRSVPWKNEAAWLDGEVTL